MPTIDASGAGDWPRRRCCNRLVCGSPERPDLFDARHPGTGAASGERTKAVNMTLEAQAPARNVQPHATSGRRSAFEKLRAFSRLNPRLAPPLARTMLRPRSGEDAAAFAQWAD